MSGFDHLHLAIQHHIVNSLGWSSLRPLQEAAILPILQGQHALLLAPTAGGKTEAAIFPAFSRMLTENWQGLTTLYICPIKALLNNLEYRLSHFAGLLGRRVELWHGDIQDSRRQRTSRVPPDLLLTTPESLESILVSRRIDHKLFFGEIRMVIVDEVHAFAGDDRGWHLLSLLERVGFLSGRDLQRIGLSATVGNPDQLLAWLCGSSTTPGSVIHPSVSPASQPDIQVDYVGTLAHAAKVIALLHRGEKRLVFCDSRSQVEQLAVVLRSYEVETHVSHSSLGLDERKRAETAFAEGQDCVIVATSTLELGMDVGDLDRVIQIDAPHTVASFLQRLGRTGRRPGTRRNCLFLTTSESSFLRALGIVELWREGYVEPVRPPPLPFHILAQQIMALALQESGIGFQSWRQQIGRMPGFAAMSVEEQDEIVHFMLSSSILFQEEGLLMMGEDGAAHFGRQHFMELLSVFTSPPMFKVFHGRREIGQVHPHSFATRDPSSTAVITLAGQNWRVSHIQWSKHVAFVEPTWETGRSRWQGSGQPMHFELCQSIAHILMEKTIPLSLSKRGQALLENIREEFAWLEVDQSCLVQGIQEIRWWNFAGGLFNSWMASCLNQCGIKASPDDFSLTVKTPDPSKDMRLLLESCLNSPDNDEPLSKEKVDGLKFSQCLPTSAIQKMQRQRLELGKIRERLSRQKIILVNFTTDYPK